MVKLELLFRLLTSCKVYVDFSILQKIWLACV